MIEARLLSRIPEIRHGFFTREGGYSTGIYASLNIGYGSRDDRETVRRNRDHVATALGLTAGELVTPYQHHSADVVEVETPWTWDDAPKADGLVTARPGLALGVATADCAPVLFSDTRAGVIGAAHAGWRGALAGITDAVIAAMERLGADRADIVAAIGPCISAQAYEVGPEFRERFLDADAQNARFFGPAAREGHWLFDLPRYVETRLERAGLRSIERIDACTYADEQRFFSYRRATHRGE